MTEVFLIIRSGGAGNQLVYLIVSLMSIFSRRKFFWTLGGTIELVALSALAVGPREFWSQNVSLRAFAASIGERFVVWGSSSEGTRLSLELVRVREKVRRTGHLLHSESEIAGNERFSLIFQGPLETQLQQGTYRFKNGRLGTMDIFVVPVGLPDNGYQHYEAIFNRPNRSRNLRSAQALDLPG
jgi:hypothetical protein